MQRGAGFLFLAEFQDCTELTSSDWLPRIRSFIKHYISLEDFTEP